MFPLGSPASEAARHFCTAASKIALSLTVVGLLAASLISDVAAAPPAGSSCHLASAHGDIQHVIYIQFDNTHFLRDNPNVPSDLEQMPHLLNFITDNGTLLANDHTALISHTATGILTSPAGLELLPLFHDRRHQPHRRLVRILDSAPVRSSRSSIPTCGSNGPDADDD
jgi:hypothetical protein